MGRFMYRGLLLISQHYFRCPQGGIKDPIVLFVNISKWMLSEILHHHNQSTDLIVLF